MSSSDTFPILTPGQIARIGHFATERGLADGESLWSQGDRSTPLFVVVEGEVAILSGRDHLVTGVFAVGDVRSGSVKRVAAAVGEGSVCVQLVHKVLAQ